MDVGFSGDLKLKVVVNVDTNAYCCVCNRLALYALPNVS